MRKVCGSSLCVLRVGINQSSGFNPDDWLLSVMIEKDSQTYLLL